MEVVFLVSKELYPKFLDRLKADEKVSRASVKSREASFVEKEGYFVIISGEEEVCKKAEEIANAFLKKLEAKEAEEILKKIKEEEEKASQAFGAIFG